MTTSEQQAVPVAQERESALATAFCLLDTFAGEGLGHTYRNGQQIDADTTVFALCTAFDMEPEDGWYRTLATELAALPLPCKSGEGAGEDALEADRLRVLTYEIIGRHGLAEGAARDIASLVMVKLGLTRLGRSGIDPAIAIGGPHCTREAEGECAEDSVASARARLSIAAVKARNRGGERAPVEVLADDVAVLLVAHADLARALTPDATQTREAEVREAAEALLLAMTKRALRGRDHVPSMRDEQTAASALRAALNARGGA